MIIQKFETNDLLRDYLKYTLQHPQIMKIDTVAKYYAFQVQNYSALRQLANQEVTLDQFTEAMVEAMEEQECFEKYTSLFYSLNSFVYLFPWSKTIYRKTVHPNVVDSTYKKLYNLLKNIDYIVEATGNYVSLSPCSVSQEKFDVFLGESNNINEKSIQSVISYIQEISGDHTYYINIIDALENKIKDLESINNDLSRQLTSRSLTTWY